MLLRLFRKTYTDKSIIGDFYIDGERVAYSLENTQKAIPGGNYLVILSYSPRFQRDMPLICNVPGREGIRIHSANYPHELEGCIALGLDKGEDMIFKSRAACKALYERLKAHPGDIAIDIG